ncbi:MAG: hydrogenase formation protein HypD [Sandaracinaceae bacterium]
MRHLDVYRDPRAVKRLVAAVRRATTRPWTIMEICGGQTHSIARYGLEDLIGEDITLVHGPGCPVCVTPLEVLEKARRLALQPDVVLHTYGDMLRVPGVHGDLLDARARGADVRIVLSALDAVRAAARDPARHHVFFAVGFETTAPATAMAIEHAAQLGLDRFSVLASHVRVPPAMEAILSDPDGRVDGFLAAGHVCTIEGDADYHELAARFSAPIVITGFEPLDIVRGLLACVRQLEAGQHEVDNAYPRAVRPEGNPVARAALRRVFSPADVPWRGLGVLPRGGLRIRPEYAPFDAELRFPMSLDPIEEPKACRANEVLRGLLAPLDCPELGRGCTPEHPLGAPMVSTEGACAAYYRYRRMA